MPQEFKLLSNISITQIQLDTSNFRLGEQSNEQACITKILQDKNMSSHLIELAKDIAKHGLFLDEIIVRKEEEILIVVDGNRRLTALKLLHAPSKSIKKFQKTFQKIAENAQVPITTKIRCKCYNNQEDYLNHMERLHLGEQYGAGQVRWGPFEKDNLSLMRGTGNLSYPNARAIYNYLQSIGATNIDEMKISTLDRLFQSKALRDIIDIEVVDNILRFLTDQQLATNRLIKIIEDFTRKDSRLTVRDIISKELAEKYLQNILTINLPNYIILKDSQLVNEASNEPLQFSELNKPPQLNESSDKNLQPNEASNKPLQLGESSDTNLQQGQLIPNKPTWNRYTVIPRGTKFLTLPRQNKTINLLRELKRINPEDTPIAAGVTLRLLLECSVNYYIATHELQCEAKLNKQIIMIAEDLFEKKRITRDQKNNLSASGTNFLMTPKPLHIWVHDTHIMPDRQSINTAYDSLEFFIKLCWEK